MFTGPWDHPTWLYISPQETSSATLAPQVSPWGCTVMPP